MRIVPALMKEREQSVVDAAEANDTVLICAAGFERSELDAARGKVIANTRFAPIVLPPKAKADRTDWHLLPLLIVLLGARLMQADDYPGRLHAAGVCGDTAP